MRQAGIIAAAGIVALETMVERLAEDHERARRLAEALDERRPGCVDPARVRTNIVCASAAALPDAFVPTMLDHGVALGPIDPATYRFVTHKDFDDADLARTVVALDAVI